MKMYLIIASLLFSSGVYAGWLTDWSRWISFTIFKTKQNKQQDYAEQLRKEVQQKHDFITLLYAMNDAGVGNFFSSGGIGRIPEVSFLLSIIGEKKASRKVRAEANQLNEDHDAHYNMTGNLAKKVRELPHLGPLIEDTPLLSDYFLSFKAKLLPDGRSVLRISLVERILGTKQTQNRESGLMEAVPCVKNRVKHMFFGVEKDNGTFDWKKTIHTNNALVAKEYEADDYAQMTAEQERKYEADDGRGTHVSTGALKKSKCVPVHFEEGDVTGTRFFRRWNFPKQSAPKRVKRHSKTTAANRHNTQLVRPICFKQDDKDTKFFFQRQTVLPALYCYKG